MLWDSFFHEGDVGGDANTFIRLVRFEEAQDDLSFALVEADHDNCILIDDLMLEKVVLYLLQKFLEGGLGSPQDVGVVGICSLLLGVIVWVDWWDGVRNGKSHFLWKLVNLYTGYRINTWYKISSFLEKLIKLPKDSLLIKL